MLIWSVYICHTFHHDDIKYTNSDANEWELNLYFQIRELGTFVRGCTQKESTAFDLWKMVYMFMEYILGNVYHNWVCAVHHVVQKEGWLFCSWCYTKISNTRYFTRKGALVAMLAEKWVLRPFNLPLRFLWTHNNMTIQGGKCAFEIDWS